MNALRRARVSPATVVACIALFVGLTGTAVATVSQLPRGSVGTLQLKNNAVNSKKVKNGSLLRTDFKAGQIPAGARGPAGPAGPQGAQGVQGPAGPFPSGDVPSGTTIRGNYGTGGTRTTAQKFFFLDIAYGFQMSAPLTVHWLTAGAAATAACPGSASNPQAAAGNLCLYTRDDFGVAARDPFQTTSTRWGASPFLTSLTNLADGVVWSHGSWAATAP
jgi:hypothetical protein